MNGNCPNPFEWELPERVKGKKVEVKVVRATTLGRIFGDMPVLKNGSRHVLYTIKRFSPDNKKAPEAYCEIEFLK